MPDDVASAFSLSQKLFDCLLLVNKKISSESCSKVSLIPKNCFGKMNYGAFSTSRFLLNVPALACASKLVMARSARDN